jgi:hypothetical protein
VLISGVHKGPPEVKNPHRLFLIWFRFGFPRKEAIQISGHKTRAIFDRYNIVDNRDINNPGKALASYLKGQKK